MRKTKIICTLGPSTDDTTILRQMIKAGMNVARLNFSHGSYHEHKNRIDTIKTLREELQVPLAILLDTKGPEIRLKNFKNNSVVLKSGQEFTLTTEDVLGDETVCAVTYENLPKVLSPGNTVLIDDGLVELTVTKCTDISVTGIVKNDGKLSNRKGINLPGIDIDMPYLTEKDKEDILFGIENNVDYIAASFVRHADDVDLVRQLLDENGGKDIKIIAKIENAQGVKNADGIIRQANGIMIARGDMGVEIPFEDLPFVQKELIKKCYYAGKAVITATQMLDSMMQNPRPTRAEVTDVANAVYDGTGSIMLSGETAAGLYPVESVKTMAKIAETTEQTINYAKRFRQSEVKNNTTTDAICHAACTTALDLSAKALVAVTWGGHTARMIAKFRPPCPIIAAAVTEKAYHQLALVWGIYPLHHEKKTTSEELFNSAVHTAIEKGIATKNDVLVLAGGSTVGKGSITDTIRVHFCE